MYRKLLTSSIALGLAIVFFLPAKSFALAELKTDYTFAGANVNLPNAIVRVDETEKNGDNFTGTGTIIGIIPDGKGGKFYDVLTADHVVRDGSNDSLPTAVYIGFGNITAPDNQANFATNWPIAVNSVAQNVRYDSPVDLAVFAVDVPAVTPKNVLPANQITPATVGAANKANGQLIMAGYGSTGTPTTFQTMDAYLVTSTFGSFLAATANTYYTGTTANFTTPSASGNFNYTFQSLDDSMALTPAGSGAKATSGSAYFLKGDSGGPTFQSDGAGGLNLVGVHSASETATSKATGANVYVPVDNTTPYLDHDVDLSVNQYQQFILASQILVDQLPEPSAIIVILPLAALMALRRTTRMAR